MPEGHPLTQWMNSEARAMTRKANEAIDQNRWPDFIRTPPSSLIHGKSGVRAEFLSDCKALFWNPEFFWPHVQIKCPHCKRKPQGDGWGKIRKVVGLRTSYFVKVAASSGELGV